MQNTLPRADSAFGFDQLRVSSFPALPSLREAPANAKSPERDEGQPMDDHDAEVNNGGESEHETEHDRQVDSGSDLESGGRGVRRSTRLRRRRFVDDEAEEDNDADNEDGAAEPGADEPKVGEAEGCADEGEMVDEQSYRDAHSPRAGGEVEGHHETAEQLEIRRLRAQVATLTDRVNGRRFVIPAEAKLTYDAVMEMHARVLSVYGAHLRELSGPATLGMLEDTGFCTPAHVSANNVEFKEGKLDKEFKAYVAQIKALAATLRNLVIPKVTDIAKRNARQGHLSDRAAVTSRKRAAQVADAEAIAGIRRRRLE